ncbi:phage terminase small subunit [Algicola sagamiensis]|uniref:phage terminase small subunit n=1 Tax=Algicola sagamiensis TaxID=163869 RepID=UPI000365D890|nr:phage terminase small subunit [Algicola sagamiensis]
MSLVRQQIAKARQTKSTAAQDKSKNTASPRHTEVPSTSNQYDLLKAALESDLGSLKQIAEVEKKHAYKATALEKNGYLNYLNIYRDEGHDHPNTILVWVFIWLVDLQRWSDAFEWLPLMVSQKQKLPTKFSTQDWPTFVIDQLYDAGNAQLEQGREAILHSGILSHFCTFISLFESHSWSVASVVGGKLYAMAGKLHAAVLNDGNALDCFVKAQQLNEGAGVKKIARDIASKRGIELDI